MPHDRPVKQSRKGVAPARRMSHRDSVVSERSDYGHWALEKAVVDLCGSDGMRPLTNEDVDLLVQSGPVSVLFEVKSCTADERGTQVREAIYQLLEYRFLYRDRIGPNVRLCIVAERRPSGSVDWLMSYTEHLGIGMIWRDESIGRLVCSRFTKNLLADVLPSIAGLPSEPSV